MTFNGDRIDLPRIVIVKLQDKVKVRQLMKRETLHSPHNVEAGNNMWFTLATGTQETI